MGHSSFSAPLYLRNFFQRVLESTKEGNPEMTIVRMASGSVVGRGCVLRGGGRESFFTDSLFFGYVPHSSDSVYNIV